MDKRDIITLPKTLTVDQMLVQGRRQQQQAKQQPAPQTRIQAKISDYFNGKGSVENTVPPSGRRSHQRSHRNADATNFASQPTLMNGREYEQNDVLSDNNQRGQKKQRVQSKRCIVSTDRQKPMVRIMDAENIVHSFNDSSGSDGYEPFTERSPKYGRGNDDFDFQNDGNNNIQLQLSKMRESLTLGERKEIIRSKLRKDFRGLGLRQLMSTEKDLVDSRIEVLSSQKQLQRERNRENESMDTVEDTELNQEQAAILSQHFASGQGITDHLQTDRIHETNFSPEQRLEGVPEIELLDYAASHDRLVEKLVKPVRRPQSRDFGNRKISVPVDMLQRHGDHYDQLKSVHQPHRRLFSSINSKSHFLLGSIATKITEKHQSSQAPGALPHTQRANRVHILRKGQQNRVGTAPFLSKVQKQSKNGMGNINLMQKMASVSSYQQLSQAKKPSHVQKMLSKITVFKKKIEIDDEQNRLGPTNRVNQPKHNALYFKTNPQNLLLKILGPKNYQRECDNNNIDIDDSFSSDTDSTHSYRSKIAQNEAVMKKPNSPMNTRKHHYASLNQKNGKKDAERLLRQKSMAPVKDWTSTVTVRIQNNKFGIETTKKHYEREAVAKYIYNKFGVHLLTYNHQTRNEVIPMFGEHVRQKNAQVFNDDKNSLQNRKNSAMRSHLIGLQRNLKNQNLAMPKQLQGAEAEKFVRRRIFEEQSGLIIAEKENQAHYRENSFMKSPQRSQSSIILEQGLLSTQYNQTHMSPFQLQSHRSQAKFKENYDDDELEIYQFLPARPVIDQNMDNLEWQRNALKMQSLRDLYAAKCQDLKIEKDANQFEKFCTHIISKAKNRCLNLSNCYLKEYSAQVLARQFMMLNHAISSYDLSFNELGDKGMATIAEALYRTSHIVYLNLDMNKIQWEGVQYLSKALCENNSLINLSLSSGKSGGNNRNRVMEHGAYALAEALSVNRYLLILNLTGNAIGNEGLSYLLPAILQSDTLVSLNLTSNEITCGPIRQSVLRDNLRQGFTSRYVSERDWTSLKHFKHHGANNMMAAEDDSDEEEQKKEKKRYRLQSAYVIKEFIQRTRSLKELTLKANKLGDEGVTVIAEALSIYEHRQCSLQLLNLTNVGMTYKAFQDLLQAMKTNHDLHTLILDKNNLNTTFAFNPINSIIAAGSSLKVLSLAHCHLVDTFGCQFANAMKTNKGLVRFNFYGNDMTSRTLINLAIALKDNMGSLQEFNLGKNSLNDKGGIKLSEVLSKNSKIVKINLCDNNLTDETALAINRNLLSNKALEEINLKKNLINIRVLEMLQVTVLKIRELKLQAQLPDWIEKKQQYRNNQEHQERMDIELLDAQASKKREDILERKARQNCKIAEVRGHKEQVQYDKQKRSLRQTEIELEDEERQLDRLKGEENEDFDIKQRCMQRDVDRELLQIKNIQDALKKAEDKLYMKRGNHEAFKNKSTKELENWEEFESVSKSVWLRKEKEYEALMKAFSNGGRGSRSGGTEGLGTNSQASVSNRTKSNQIKKETNRAKLTTKNSLLESEVRSAYTISKVTPRRNVESSSHLQIINKEGKASIQSGAQQSEFSNSRQQNVSKVHLKAEIATAGAAQQNVRSLNQKKLSTMLTAGAKSNDAASTQVSKKRPHISVTKSKPSTANATVPQRNVQLKRVN